MAGDNIRALLENAARLHQAGRLEDAAPLYQKVLETNPNNADALHLLGMIDLQQGRAAKALKLISRAIALNGREASYHFHLGLAAQNLGEIEAAVSSYRTALTLDPTNPDIYNNIGNALAAQKNLDEAADALHKALALQPSNAIILNNLGNVQFEMGLLDQAEASFQKALNLQPQFSGALVNLGNLNREKDNLRKAEGFYRRAIASAPNETAAHCGLGATLWQLGRHLDAKKSYRIALSINPGHKETLINLSICCWEEGGLDDAEYLLINALKMLPRDTDIINNLTALRLAKDDITGAMELNNQSLEILETYEAKKLFVEISRRSTCGSESAVISRFIARAITETWGKPAELNRISARLIRSNKIISPLVMKANASWPKRLNLDEMLTGFSISELADDPLLSALLTSAPNYDISLERFLTLLRGAIIREFFQATSVGEEMERFAAVLARQCFINEYVFHESEEEVAIVSKLRSALETSTVIIPIQLLLAAAYFPLHTLSNSEKLLQRSWSASVEAVVTQQVREPIQEQNLREIIPRLTIIRDPVSLLVQDQYETNPYPRWVKMPVEKPDTIVNFLLGKFPFAQFEITPGRKMKDILIAGCGTGQRSIAMAQKFGDQHMLAIDLSLSSLSYARRQSEDLGLRINYCQADLLELESTSAHFDIIESIGVLHHLDDPWTGWRTLLKLLRPGGFMFIGVYSHMARRPIVGARARIDKLGISGSPDNIRGFRQDFIQDGDKKLYASILDSDDFFSLSACRDLLFHVKEHHMRLKDIDIFIKDQNLHFLGFELNDSVLAAYRKSYPHDKAAIDITSWEEFEAIHPGLFGGMYSFWIQRPSVATTIN